MPSLYLLQPTGWVLRSDHFIERCWVTTMKPVQFQVTLYFIFVHTVESQHTEPEGVQYSEKNWNAQRSGTDCYMGVNDAFHACTVEPVHSGHPIRAENKDFRLIGHLCASRFPTMVYCSFMPGQITNLTGKKAILFGICPMTACYFQRSG